MIVGNALTASVTRQTWMFCVEGDTLWLESAMAEFPELALVRYERRMSHAP